MTNKSVFATIALHMTYSTAFSTMPYYGSSYSAKYMVVATCIVGIIVFLLNGKWKQSRYWMNMTRSKLRCSVI
ncbi:MAG TPA: hypothetical protein VHB70_06020 [Parafilimonas sp.]|nr:hypothetical protein [Parafilimonas sp.]